MERFAGRVAVVTGAASGLGAALAGVLAREGMHVAAADLDGPGAERVAAELRSAGQAASAFDLDVGERGSIDALAQAVHEQLGDCALLCANVGVVQLGAFDRVSAEEWEWVMRVNLLGTAHTARAFLPQLRRQAGDAHMLFTASINGVFAAPHMAVYAASKYGVIGLAESLRLELAPEGIGVTALLPGGMQTTHIQSSQVARPDALPGEVASEHDTAVVSRDMSNAAVIGPDVAVRHLIRDLRANHPYIVTHDVLRRRFTERVESILAAYDRAREGSP